MCARARGAVGWTALPTKSGVRYFPSIQKFASKARRPNRVATAPTELEALRKRPALLSSPPSSPSSGFGGSRASAMCWIHAGP